MMKPIENSYCVLGEKIFAGEYAGDKHNPQEKVDRLKAFGITHIIDLTEEGELKPYKQLLGDSVVHRRFPIKDLSAPKEYWEVYELLDYIKSVIAKDDNKVYIHCWGGVGRTGTIVACLYEFLGEDYEHALVHLRRSFKACPKSQWRETPETNEQLEFIRGFKEYLKQRKASREARRYTPENIKSLQPDEVFVFGSNLAGRHGGGAARVAWERFGAVMGVGVGLQGQSYAIPTMQGGVETIKPYVDEFIEYAKSRPELKFYVTRIGCGIAGFKDEEIAPLFSEAIGVENIILPKSFAELIQGQFPFDTFDTAAFEEMINWTLPGLQLFYRDTNMQMDLDVLAEAYRKKNIIRAGFFIDCTSRAAKPVKRIRFIIASAHAAAIWQVMGDAEAEQWRLNVLDYNSYFKVVDTYRVGEQLQILLLHIPLKGLAMFAGMGNISIGEDMDLVEIARKSFDEKLKMEPLPWLETKAWNDRTELLPGTTSEGWATLEPVEPMNEQVSTLHSAILKLSHDDTDLNRPD
ncbi:MAG: tyrosine-protein phosphatase [Muribaculaceae bacterium]|nr:tyrosine-protein phosphatase [Muribaculaceae bacterium]